MCNSEQDGTERPKFNVSGGPGNPDLAAIVEQYRKANGGLDPTREWWAGWSARADYERRAKLREELNQYRAAKVPAR